MGGYLLIISDQEDETLWKILAMKNLLPDIGFTKQDIIPQQLLKKS